MTIVKRIGEGHLVINIIDLNQKTIVLILPGGGYQLLSNRESGPVATKFNMMGYNTAILYYTCKSLVPLSEGLEALKELSKSFSDIVVIGFSAGGHLASLLGTEHAKYNLKAMVLSYPVITFLDHTHEETAHSFLGKDDNLENRMKYSSERRVSIDTVPTFIWTTKDDELVPVENTILMKDALERFHIYHEVIVFEHGAHGLALADETAVVGGDYDKYYRKDIAIWVDKADAFIKKVIESKNNKK